MLSCQTFAHVLVACLRARLHFISIHKILSIVLQVIAGAFVENSLGGLLRGCRCAIDTQPRSFDAESCNLLCNFAEMVVREIEKEKVRVSSFNQVHPLC